MGERVYTLDLGEISQERLDLLQDMLTGEMADEFNVLTKMVNDEHYARQMAAARKGFDALRTCTQALLEEGYASVHERAEREQLTAGMRPLLGMLGFDGPAQHRALEELLRNDQPHAIHTTCRWCGLEIEGWSDNDKYSEDWRDRGNNRRCNDGLHNHEPVDG